MGIYFEFKADEGLAPETYSKALRKPEDSTSTVALFSAIARACDLYISKETQERWLRVYTYCIYLDWLLDDANHPQAQDIFRALVQGQIRDAKELPSAFPDWMKTGVIAAAQLYDSAMQDFPDEPQIRALGLNIGEYAQHKPTARTSKAYAQAVMREGWLVGLLLATCVSSSDKQRPAFSRFREGLVRFMVWNNLTEASSIYEKTIRKDLSDSSPML